MAKVTPNTPQTTSCAYTGQVILVACPEDAGKRLDTFLHERLPEFSRSRLQSWIKSGQVRGTVPTKRPSQTLHGNETISIQPIELKPLNAEPENIPLQILYQDSDVVVINKPAGMVVHAGAGHRDGTLVNALLYHFGTLSSINGGFRPGIVHRLDRETSGVLVVARTDAAHQSLARQFHDREVEKVYLTLVHGKVSSATGRITSPITRDPVRRIRMTTRIGTGRSALTDYQVLAASGQFSFLQIRIGTGRTHQIRVHLAGIGHPVLGDRLYGAPPMPPEFQLPDRFFLHAHRLRFTSPTSGQSITVESALPVELATVLKAINFRSPIE